MKKVTLVLLCVLQFSCSTFRETHYFKDNLTPIPNYYRVKVKGSTLMTSSRYVSGYYDRGAVQAYFSELSQPDKGKFPVSIASTNSNCDDCEKELKDKELVLLLSTNSDAIANKDKIDESNKVKSELSNVDTEIELFIAKVDAYLSLNVDDNTTADEIKSRLMQLVKSEIKNLPSDPNLVDTFKELQEVYLSNKE